MKKKTEKKETNIIDLLKAVNAERHVRLTFFQIKVGLFTMLGKDEVVFYISILIETD